MSDENKVTDTNDSEHKSAPVVEDTSLQYHEKAVVIKKNTK